jgi:hypothetical protein
MVLSMKSMVSGNASPVFAQMMRSFGHHSRRRMRQATLSLPPERSRTGTSCRSMAAFLRYRPGTSVKSSGRSFIASSMSWRRRQFA